MENNKLNGFYENSLKGHTAKILLEHLFKHAGFETYPFGYESMFSRITSGINKTGTQSETMKRIRSAPDLLVVSPNKSDVYLIETKFIGFSKTNSVMLSKIQLEKYRRYWSDSILVVIIPSSDYIYAQEISQLQIPENAYPHSGGPVYYFDLKKQFKPIYEIFKEIKKEEIEEFKSIIDKIKPELKIKS